MNILELLNENRFESMIKRIGKGGKPEAIKQINLDFQKQRNSLSSKSVHTLDNKLHQLSQVVEMFLSKDYSLKKSIKEYNDILEEIRKLGVKV